MSSTRLPHYLRAGRKRTALSQDEVAFLMGDRGGTKISRYEKFLRVPNLEAAFAFEVIYGKPINEMFAGLRQEIVGDVQKRAKILRHRLSFHQPDALSRRRRRAIDAIIAPTSGAAVL
jgi:hypothetical protein